MPEKRTLEKARKDRREVKAPSTQAGEFVHEEIEHIRKGKHGARSAKQAIAIGLSKARRAGIKLPAPTNPTTAGTRKKAQQDLEAGQSKNHKTSSKRSRSAIATLKKEGRAAASHRALSRQARHAAH